MKLFKNLFLINGGIALLLSIFLIITIIEYRFFKQQAHELISIQEQYRTALTMLRKSLDVCGGPEEDSKDDEESSSSFSAVNRDPVYLKESALSFLKKQHPREVAMMSAWYKQHAQYAIEAEKKGSSSRKRSLPKHKQRKKIKNYRRSWMSTNQEPVVIDRKFSWPLERGRFWISSLFGNRRKRDGSIGFHTGIDLAALRGTLIYAARSGKVIEAGYDAGYGNTIVVKHSDQYKTRYAHMDRLLARNGQIVAEGQKIGTVGATGNVRASRGNDPSHLHFEVYVNRRPVNPLNCLP